MCARKLVGRMSAVLIVALAALISESCSKVSLEDSRESNISEAPTVAVAKAKLEDMSRALVLTAEFKPFQEIDVMAKVAGYVKEDQR